MLNLEEVARICHEAHRAYVSILGQRSVPWFSLNIKEQRDRMNAVKWVMLHPQTTPEEIHHRWVTDKQDTGWHLGPVISYTTKTHPSLVPWAELSSYEKRKVVLFLSIVRACTQDEL